MRINTGTWIDRGTFIFLQPSRFQTTVQQHTPKVQKNGESITTNSSRLFSIDRRDRQTTTTEAVTSTSTSEAAQLGRSCRCHSLSFIDYDLSKTPWRKHIDGPGQRQVSRNIRGIRPNDGRTSYQLRLIRSPPKRACLGHASRTNPLANATLLSGPDAVHCTPSLIVIIVYDYLGFVNRYLPYFTCTWIINCMKINQANYQ